MYEKRKSESERERARNERKIQNKEGTNAWRNRNETKSKFSKHWKNIHQNLKYIDRKENPKIEKDTKWARWAGWASKETEMKKLKLKENRHTQNTCVIIIKIKKHFRLTQKFRLENEYNNMMSTLLFAFVRHQRVCCLVIFLIFRGNKKKRNKISRKKKWETIREKWKSPDRKREREEEIMNEGKTKKKEGRNQVNDRFVSRRNGQIIIAKAEVKCAPSREKKMLFHQLNLKIFVYHI